RPVPTPSSARPSAPTSSPTPSCAAPPWRVTRRRARSPGGTPEVDSPVPGATTRDRLPASVTATAPTGDPVEEPTHRIRVLLVDDHAVVRMGLRASFDLQADIEGVGEASGGSEGVATAP